MSKIYGGRWKIIESKARGGQSEIYLVEDSSGQITAPAVLKRVFNTKRRHRFQAEVTACKRLSHPNIITLFDHSALDEGSEDEKSYLVMPLCHDGNLADRVALYKNSLDSTLSVAKQLSEALHCAHSAGVIHRDVKPENILFDKKDHHPILSDFGIALLIDQPRNTELPEVVGPRAFIAPELEAGGEVEVTPAADIYSLGKVIYYMLTGGIILPRERHREAKFKLPDFGSKGDLLKMLLDKMICLKEQRLETMKEVSDRIEKILNWDKQQSPALTPNAIAALTKINSTDLTSKSNSEHNKAVHAAMKEKLTAYLKMSSEWLEAFLNQTLPAISNLDALEATVSVMDVEKLKRIIVGPTEALEARKGVGLVIHRKEQTFNKHQILAFLLCEKFAGMNITFGSNVRRAEERDQKIVFVPIYFQLQQADPYFFVRRSFKEAVARNPGDARLRGRAPSYLLQRTFHNTACSLGLETTIGSWPQDLDAYKAVVQEALELFFEHMQKAESGMTSYGN